MQFKCQACGFTVFNRRYPKCESCGVELAAGMALSSTERQALFEADAQEAERAWRERQKTASQDAAGGDAPYLG